MEYYSSYAYRDNGRILFSNDYDTKEYNYLEKEWYLLDKNTKETMVWTDPFFDKTSNAMILTTAVPFYNNNTKSNNEIETLITEIQEDISNVVKAMEDGDSSIQEGKLLINLLKNDFKQTGTLVNKACSTKKGPSQRMAFKLAVTDSALNLTSNRSDHQVVAFLFDFSGCMQKLRQ